MSSTPRYLAQFDSAAAMARALASGLGGGAYDPMGLSAPLRGAAALANRLPRRARKRIYAWAGYFQSVGPRQVKEIDAERISRWFCGLYPRRPYPALFVGASNGAAMHLATALSAPWLPQTVLVPVWHPRWSADDARGQLEAVRELGLEVLRRNEEFVLHQMHDPNQDRLMIRYMAYFRLKRRWLGSTYEAFIHEVLPPGATIFIVDCRLTWPVATIGPRYFFQHGGLGGATIEEMIESGERVAAFLARESSPRRDWDPPPPDCTKAESEWGYGRELDEDIRRVAEGRYGVVRITFEDPDDLSPLVADLLRWWYGKCGFHPGTLLLDSFILLEPDLARRMAAVPFWTKFSVDSSLAALKAYLEDGRSFDRAGLALFAHGVESIGVVPAPRWKELVQGYVGHSRYLGVDEARHPADLAVYFRYRDAMKAFADRTVEPPPIPLEQFRAFVEENRGRYRVQIEF